MTHALMSFRVEIISAPFFARFAQLPHLSMVGCQDLFLHDACQQTTQQRGKTKCEKLSISAYCGFLLPFIKLHCIIFRITIIGRASEVTKLFATIFRSIKNNLIALRYTKRPRPLTYLRYLITPEIVGYAENRVDAGLGQMILSSFQDFLHENSLENRVVLEVGQVLSWTIVYPTFDLPYHPTDCKDHFTLTPRKSVGVCDSQLSSIK